MSKFEILCVTMHQSDFSKIKEMNINSDIVFANQSDRTDYQELDFGNHKAKMISTNTRGVGINRNVALLYASADICLLADDDVKYRDDVENIVLSEFAKYPDADVFVFNINPTDVYDNDRVQTPTYSKTRKWRKFSRTPWGAVRIAFRLSSIKKSNVWFTTLFGGGATFAAGEDSIWIKDLKRRGLKFYVSSQTIGDVSFETSSWYTGIDERYFYGHGAYFASRYRWSLYLWFVRDIIRTRGKGRMPFLTKWKWLNYGKDGYKNLKSFQAYIKEKNIDMPIG